MLLVNCKVELKLKWTKYCALSVVGNDNTNDNLAVLVLLRKTQNYMVLSSLYP